MIVGIPAMQIPLDSHASHPSPESSGATPTATAPYDSTSQMHPLGMPPQQVYLSGEMTDMGALAHQFQALGMPTQQQPPQAGDSEIGDDNDGTTETEEDPVKLFVGQVPKKLSEEDIFPTFDGFGPLKDVAIIRDKATGLHRGCAFVTFWNAADAERAQEALHDKFSFPGARKPTQVKPAEPSGTTSETKLFIGMLSRKAGEEDVRELFGPFGEIREIHMIRGADGTSKCAAFLRYTSHDAAIQAIDSMNSHVKMDGSSRPLIVKFADNKHQKQQRHFRNMRRHDMMAVMGGVPNGYPQYPQHGPPHMGMPPVHHPGAGPPPVHHTHHPGAGPPYPMPPPQYAPGPSPQYAPGPSPQFVPGPYGPPGAGPPHHPPHPYMFPPHQFVPQALMPWGMDSQPVQNEGHHSRPREGPAGANLFVYHLPHDLTDADLATAFNPFGNVISAKVYVDKYTGESKGFGFVSYDSVIAAESAIEQMNGFQIGNKRLKVQHKRVHGMNPTLAPHEDQRQPPPYPGPGGG